MKHSAQAVQQRITKESHCSAGWFRSGKSFVFICSVLIAVCARAAYADDDAVNLFRAILPQLRAAHPESYDTPEQLQSGWKQFLETLALSRTARVMGYADRPSLRYRVEQMFAQELILCDAEKVRPIESITEAEIDAHFDRYRHCFDAPAMMSVHEIVLRFDPKRPDERSQQQRKAAQIRKSLGSGIVALERFIEVMQTESDAGFFRTNNGSLGTFPVSSISNSPPRMPIRAAEELLTTKQLGALTSVHEFGETFRIYRLSGYSDPVTASEAGIREGIRRAIYLQAREKRIRELVGLSGIRFDGELTEQQIGELLVLGASNKLQRADLPPSPAGLDIPQPDSAPSAALGIR